MRTLGLDISSVSTGWAVLSDGPALVDFGRLEFSKSKSVKDKLILFSSLLRQLLLTHKPFDYVIIEDTFCSKNVSTTKLLNKFSGVAIYTVYAELGDVVNIASIMPASIRSAISEDVINYLSSLSFKKSKNIVDKNEVFEYIIYKYKLNSLKFNTDNDITDAIAAATYPFKKQVNKKWLL